MSTPGAEIAPMSLQRMEGEIDRETYGFAFPMRVSGTAQTVRVIVCDEALIAIARAPDDDELGALLDADLSAFESLANDKYAHGRVTTDGSVFISLGDVLGFIE